MAKGILVVHTTPAAGRDQEYHDWYNDVHLIDVVKLAGFTSARRFKRVDDGDDSRYLAIYEVEADDLKEAQAGIGRGVASGDVRMSDVVSMDPPPELVLYEQVHEHLG